MAKQSRIQHKRPKGHRAHKRSSTPAQPQSMIGWKGKAVIGRDERKLERRIEQAHDQAQAEWLAREA